MKSLRRTIILIIFLLVSVASMATGVFAWFIDYGNAAHVGEFNQTVQSDNDIVQVNPNEQEIFLGDTIRDLVHLYDYEFNIPGFDFYGYSSVIKMSITNPNPDPNHVATVRLSLRAIAAPEFQQYDGYTAELYFLVLEESTLLSQPDLMAETMRDLQKSPNIFAAMNAYNIAGHQLASGETKNYYIYIWGSYDNLSEAQKKVYHALVYRIIVTV